MSADDFWADAHIISMYTRRQAIEDGVLVDLDVGDLAGMSREAGFRFPVACTAAVFASCVALTPAAERAGNDVKGRVWDVLWMLSNAIRRSAGGTSTVAFELYIIRDHTYPTRTDLKAICHPDDDGKPAITIMFPEED